jgi:Concanavalin A-like lectin/glucanases superfamily
MLVPFRVLIANVCQRRWFNRSRICNIAAGVATLLLLPALASIAYCEDKPKLSDSLIFHASFDGSLDAKPIVANGDGKAYTADSPGMKVFEQGNSISEIEIAKSAGRLGDALRFSAKSQKVLCYKAATNGFEPAENWSGTVSLWLKLNPDKDLPEGYCDPLQITAKQWDDASFFVDFDQTLPRDFRLGVFSDRSVWNPNNTSWEEFPIAERPMIPVKKPPFASDSWTHVVFTFGNLNSTTQKPSTASLFLNGELQGSLERPIKFTWSKSADGSKEAMIMLGINYVGDMDELAIFRRALSPEEVKQLFEKPEQLSSGSEATGQKAK